LPVLSKYKPREKISRVVGFGSSACPVVVCAGTVELPVAGLLNHQINVLLRPPGKIQDVPFARHFRLADALSEANERRNRISGRINAPHIS
jgi:hypothetical protein